MRERQRGRGAVDGWIKKKKDKRSNKEIVSRERKMERGM